MKICECYNNIAVICNGQRDKLTHLAVENKSLKTSIMKQIIRNIFGLTPKRVRHVQTQFESALAIKVISPLSNITLANEMMEANQKDSDMKLFSDIIKRNCNRINQMVIDTRVNQMSFVFAEK
jgi:hypothetical protein